MQPRLVNATSQGRSGFSLSLFLSPAQLGVKCLPAQLWEWGAHGGLMLRAHLVGSAATIGTGIVGPCKSWLSVDESGGRV